MLMKTVADHYDYNDHVCLTMSRCCARAALQGAAGPGLLRSYEAERRPVALANTALSVANWHAAMRIPQARPWPQHP